MEIKDYLNECVNDLSEIIHIKIGDLNSLELQMQTLEEEIMKLKVKRGVYRYYLKQKGELINEN